MLLLAIILTSCNDGKKHNYLPTSVGAINSMVVVIPNSLWKSQVGDTIRKHFAAPVLGMPMGRAPVQYRPDRPPVLYRSVRQTRSVLYVMKDSVNVAHVKTDMYATPQKSV